MLIQEVNPVGLRIRCSWRSGIKCLLGRRSFIFLTAEDLNSAMMLTEAFFRPSTLQVRVGVQQKQINIPDPTAKAWAWFISKGRRF